LNEAWHHYWALLGLGDIHQKRGNVAAALKSYQASHALTERLAETNPDNAQWQRDLAISCGRIGDAQKVQGNLARR
jgi:Tetratricopeptide repeat